MLPARGGESTQTRRSLYGGSRARLIGSGAASGRPLLDAQESVSMSKIFALCRAAVLGTALMQPAAAGARSGTELPISSYDDDPFVAEAALERMSRRAFDRGADGRPI